MNRSVNRSINRRLVLGALTSSVLLGLTPSPSSSQALTPPRAESTRPDSVVMAQAETMPPFTLNEFQTDAMTVLNLGAEPRQVLQIQPAANTQQQSVITLDMEGTMTASGVTQTLPQSPTTTMVLATDVAHIDELGNRHINFEYTDVQVDGSSALPAEAVEAMRSQLSQLEGLAGTWVLNEQGYISQFTMTTPDAMSPLMAQSLEQTVDSLQQMSAPLPSEAIGIGAQWEMPYRASVNGVEMSGVAAYELVSHEGNQITLMVGVEQTGTSTQMNGLGLPGNVEVGVQQLDMSGQGSIAIDLTQIMPLQSNMAMTSASQFNVNHEGIDIPVAMTLLMNMVLASQ